MDHRNRADIDLGDPLLLTARDGVGGFLSPFGIEVVVICLVNPQETFASSGALKRISQHNTMRSVIGQMALEVGQVAIAASMQYIVVIRHNRRAANRSILLVGWRDGNDSLECELIRP